MIIINLLLNCLFQEGNCLTCFSNLSIDRDISDIFKEVDDIASDIMGDNLHEVAKEGTNNDDAMYGINGEDINREQDPY